VSAFAATASGRRVADRYELVRPLGAGGMARVWLARDHNLARHVALKLLSPALVGDPAFTARFRREAQAAAALNHPNVVATYDWGVDGETHFIAMEYVPGPTLKALIQTRGALPEFEALDLATGVADALEAAHAQGLIHRDVKPHNVLLDAAGRPKLVDFGIARALGAADTTASIMGTAAYLSPEQARGSPVDARTDVYGLGVLLFELVTGRPPFVGESPVDLLRQHLDDAPPSPRSLAPGLSAAAEAIVATAMAKDPSARYPSASAAGAAIRAARGDEGETIVAPRSPTPAVANRAMLGALPVWAPLAAGAVVIAVAVALFVPRSETRPSATATAVVPSLTSAATPSVVLTVLPDPTRPPSPTPSPQPPTATSAPAPTATPQPPSRVEGRSEPPAKGRGATKPSKGNKDRDD
jgi:serine/threonine-protein kinase